MKRVLITFTLFASFLIACKKDSSVAPMAGSVDDVAFNTYEQHFLDEFWKLNPDWGTSVGYHKYDSLLLIPNKSTREKQLNFAKVQLDSLGKYNPSGFLASNKMDYAIIQNQMSYLQWQIEQQKANEWDPSSYNVIGTFA